MLVRPGGAQAGVVDHLEDRVDLEVVPRRDRLAGRRVDRVAARVQARLRVRAQVHDLARIRVVAVRVDRAALIKGRERLAAGVVEQIRHVVELVVRRVEDDIASGRRLPRRAGCTRLVDGVAVLDVVIDTGRTGVTARHDRRSTRIRVRRVRRMVIGELGPARRKPGQLRHRVGLDIPVQIGLMHPVDRDQQHVLDRRSVRRVAKFVVTSEFVAVVGMVAEFVMSRGDRTSGVGDRCDRERSCRGAHDGTYAGGVPADAIAPTEWGSGHPSLLVRTWTLPAARYGQGVALLVSGP